MTQSSVEEGIPLSKSVSWNLFSTT
jgi:hypothetical protein